MIAISPDSIAERFMRYVRVDTQSDPTSSTHPSSEKQKELSRLLFSELQSMGIMDAETDEFGYVYATIPSNSDKKISGNLLLRTRRHGARLQRHKCQAHPSPL